MWPAANRVDRTSSIVCAGCGFRGHSVTSSDKDGSYTEHRFVYMAG